MANPSSVGTDGNYEPAIIEATTTASSVTLEPDRQYTLQHNGVDTSGAAVTDIIMLATDDSTAALTAGAGQALLLSGSLAVIGPGITTLKFDAVANAPTMTITPVYYDHGAR